MSSYLHSIHALYATDYVRREKTCMECGCTFTDVTKRNLLHTCSWKCQNTSMVAKRRANGTYVQTEEEKEKKRISCKATYASRDVFGPELRKKFSETMKKTWQRSREKTSQASVLGNAKTHWTREYDRESRLHLICRGKSGKRSDLNDQFFRSRWEANVARILNLQNRKWEYEPKIFQLKTISYTPDFYLIDEDLWIEVKGWMNVRSTTQMKEFGELFPRHRVQVVGHPEYNELRRIFASKIDAWEE